MNETNYEEIDLLELFQLLLQNLKWIIMATVLGFLLAFGVTTFLIDATYRSSSTIYIQPRVVENTINANDLTTNQKLVSTYTEIAKSNSVIDRIVPLYSGVLTKRSILSALSVAAVRDTQIIQISAITTSPDLSAQLVNRIVGIFIEEVQDIMLIDNLKVIDTAIPDPMRVGPNRTLNSLIGAVLGFMVSIGIVFLRKFLNRTIQTRLDAEKSLGIPVLGEIHFFD